MTTVKNILLALILLTALSPARGQDEKDYNQQAWIDLNPRWVMKSGKTIIRGSLGYRTIFPQEWDRYVINLGVSHSPFIHQTERNVAIQYMRFHAGVGNYYTYSIEDLNLNEVRFYQGVHLRWPSFPRVFLTHYIRIEERIEHIQHSDDYDFTMRFRYRLGARFRFLKPFLSDLYLPVSAEVFMSTGQGFYFNDVIRVTPGIGYDFTDQFSTEFQLSYHFSRNSSTESFENNDLVYRLRVYFTF